ncbi:hypothetical protein R1sor_019782 [Riccia sorocarpa]|uniref:VQ domain-containing protein n=1 Tax=Riccia sorocarpa TaxID=122646 RepID=A0ABD3IDH7_9MARC
MNNYSCIIKKSSSTRQNKRPTPLKMVPKGEVRQYRPPVIIHTYSPKVIHVEASEFSTLVQQLTGKGMKRKPECSPRSREYTDPQDGEGEVSSDSHSSAADPETLQREPQNGFESGQGFASPPSPRIYSFETQNNTEAKVHEQASLFANAVLSLAGSQYTPLLTIGSNSEPHLYSPLPSPDLSNPSFIQDLPALSASSFYQAFDPQYNHFNPSSTTFGLYAAGAPFPSPGSSNAFKDMVLMMAQTGVETRGLIGNIPARRSISIPTASIARIGNDLAPVPLYLQRLSLEGAHACSTTSIMGVMVGAHVAAISLGGPDIRMKVSGLVSIGSWLDQRQEALQAPTDWHPLCHQYQKYLLWVQELGKSSVRTPPALCIIIPRFLSMLRLPLHQIPDFSGFWNLWVLGVACSHSVSYLES